MTRIQYFLLVVLMAGISSLNPVAIDVFLPAMPEVAKALAVDPGTIGVTLGIFTLGTAVGQISFGPISDRYGRKPVVLGGLIIYTATALASAFATDVETLSVIRFIQGIAAASGRILAVAIVRDIYDKERAARLLSNIWSFSAAMPILNPFIGSWLIQYFAWQSVFVYMAIYAAVMASLILFLFRESLGQKNLEAIKPSHIFVNFGQIIRNPVYVAYTSCMVFSSSALYAFLAVASDLLITQLKQTPTTFAFEFALVMVGGMTGSIISGRISGRFSLKRMISFGLTITTLSSLTLLALALNGVFTVWAIILPYAANRVGETMITAQCLAGALSPFPDRAGAASSLLGFIRQLIGATVAILVGFYADGTALPMASAVLVCGAVPVAVYIGFLRKVAS